MSVITREILKQYITCDDPATRNKFFNLLDSYWHKTDGKLFKGQTINQKGDKTFVFINKDGVEESITIPALSNTKPISFIENLESTLNNLVTKVPGKGLSTHDLSTELLQKINSLQNYQHPEFHQIAEIENLAEALDELRAPDGFGFSEENFSTVLFQKLQQYNIDHYGNPVIDLAALAAIPNTTYKTNQRHYVESERCDYFYDAQAAEGDVAPNDQVDGTGFWIKGVNTSDVIDNLVSEETNKALSANQGRILKELYDGINAILSSDDTSLDQFQEIVNYVKANRDIFQNLSIENIAGLVDALAGKLPKGTYNGNASDLLDLINGKVSLTGNESVGGMKTFAESQKFEKAGLFKHGYIHNLPGYLSISSGFADAVSFLVGGTNQQAHFRLGNITSSRNFTFPDKSGTLALLSDLQALVPGGRPTKLIDNATQYTLVLEDKKYHLKIINPINLIAPSGVFADSDEIQFKNYSNGDVTMVEGTGTTLEVVSSQQMKVPSKGYGGMRFESASKAGVFGQLKPI